MQDEVVEHRFTPSEIVELVQRKRALAFFTEAQDWLGFTEFAEDAVSAGLVTGSATPSGPGGTKHRSA